MARMPLVAGPQRRASQRCAPASGRGQKARGGPGCTSARRPGRVIPAGAAPIVEQALRVGRIASLAWAMSGALARSWSSSIPWGSLSGEPESIH
jgi:hypothetical protein